MAALPPHEEDPVARLSRVDTSRLPPDGGTAFNRLIFEKSPYLLQHAENPIDWHPWGEEAFARAKGEDKPIFLSIGYSTCHWCHVMAHESFEDQEVARLLNRHFIAIKVDREERPDVDSTFMMACQLMTGSGGWPTTVVLTPDKKPFFAATYLPRTGRPGMAGLIPILEKIAELWLTDRARLLETGEEVTRVLRQAPAGGGEEYPLTAEPLEVAYRQYLESFDRRHAGFGPAPKFPAPHNLSLLLRIWLRTGEEKAQVMALKTLQSLRLGGIFDQIGFGLHRYSVNERWLVPHFEKMLYDQALAIQAYLDAYQASGDDFFLQTAREIVEYVRRDLGDPEGGFYCGEDADSEGEEGTFYLWTPEQVREVLGEELGAVFCRSFDITPAGNFGGKSIPHLEEDIAALAAKAGISPTDLAAHLAEARRRLLHARQQRVRPHRDDKILTGWNGLAIAALARAGAVADNREMVDAAQRAADFILARLRTKKGRLLRRFRLGEAAVPAFLEDYAFCIWGLIELYQAGFEVAHLRLATELAAAAEELFADGRGGYFDTGSDAEEVLTRGRSLQDGALPSGTSVMAWNLLRLGSLTGDVGLTERGHLVLRAGLAQVRRYPSAYAQFLVALDFALGPGGEVVIAGEETAVRPLLQALRRPFLPRLVALLRCPDDRSLDRVSRTAAGKEPLGGKPAAYLCLDRSCLPPVAEPEELVSLLADNAGRRPAGRS